MTRAGEVEAAVGVVVALEGTLMAVVEVAEAVATTAAVAAPAMVALMAATTGPLVVAVATVAGHPEAAAMKGAMSPTAGVAEVEATVEVTTTEGVADLVWVDLGVEGIMATGRAATVTTGSRSRNSTYENRRQNLQQLVRS